MKNSNFFPKSIVFVLFCLFLIRNEPVFAQNRHCAAPEIRAKNLENWPKNKPFGFINTFEHENSTAENRNIKTIPVVVHVVYFWSFENISKEQVLSQIDVLNADFRKNNGNFGQTPIEFQSIAADCQIEFCLATKDPQGNPTDGITRKQTDIINIGSKIANNGQYRIKHENTGGSDAWNEAKYLNIWVGELENGLFGYATFPNTAPFGEDGVVIDPRFFGTIGLAATSVPNHLGRTASHEVGHYFNLEHIWGGISETSCTDDDGISDTPQQKGPIYGCPSHPQLSCGNKAMFMNYMDYTDDGCMTMFTEAQKTAMLAALNGARSGLLSSAGCGAVDTQVADNQPIKCFPNPVSDVLFLENIGKLPVEIRIFNALGQSFFCVQNRVGERLEISVSELPTGFYFLKMGDFLKKFVKN
jgi:Pregnancy-associated plasma protein-A/Secretion system C-terminal sorting domain